MKPRYWERAKRELAARDRVMRKLVASYPGISLRSRGDAFSTLARSIVGQQISVKAADSVWQRLAATIAITPAAMVTAEHAALRNCGLSTRKAEYLQDLARHFADGRLDPARWRHHDDERLIAKLTEVKGIGRWTAEMFLIFHMLRPNVLPLDDIGLQRAIGLHYNGGETPDRQAMCEIAQNWAPWRSVATWYLWRSLDPQPVEY
ncbi:MAG: DNA-3-methyladenine glycosylase 2 family protein [Pseudomonadota bacterium]